MKGSKLLMFLVLLYTGGFALPVVHLSPAAKAQHNIIDRLNDEAFTIYLQWPDSARRIAEKALLLSEKAKYDVGRGRSFLNIGRVYWSQSYYPIALFYTDRALVALPKNRPLIISNAYNIRGRIYADLKNYKEALASLDISEKYADGDPDRIAEVYSERSLVYKRTGKYDEAIKNALASLRLNKIARDLDSNAAVVYGRLSGIYRLKFEDNAALAYSDTALKMSFTTQNRRLRANTYVEYAGTYFHMQDYDKAIFFAHKGGDLADSVGVVDAISSAYKIMISSYEGKSDLRQAMHYQKRYAKMQDSLNTFNKNRNTELIQEYFALNGRLDEMAAAERNVKEIKDKVRLQEAVIFTLSFSLIVVVLLLSVTYYYYKQKKRISYRLNLQNEALVSQKKMIEGQSADLEALGKVKDKLLAIIAHDLRTPLSNLRNVSDMFDAEDLTTNEVHQLMKEINLTVKSAELTLSNLLGWAGNQIKGQSITLSSLDIFLLGVEMEQTFYQALQKKNIEFENHASPGKSVLADENHIKAVLRNLISNAIKFTNSNGHVKLSCGYVEDSVIISVEDNGKGMTEEEIGRLFFTQTHFSQAGTSNEKGTGIGLLLSKELVEMNGGKLWIISEPGKGSTFYFSLPMNGEYA